MFHNVGTFTLLPWSETSVSQPWEQTSPLTYPPIHRDNVESHYVRGLEFYFSKTQNVVMNNTEETYSQDYCRKNYLLYLYGLILPVFPLIWCQVLGKNIFRLLFIFYLQLVLLLLLGKSTSSVLF